MRLQWKPYLEMPGDTYQEATDKATGITAVVECDDPGSLESWVWYLANYPVVSREPADNEGPTGRASTMEAAMHAADKALPTLQQGSDLQKREKELYESEQ